MALFKVSLNKADLAEVERMMKGIKNGYSTVVRRTINDGIKGAKIYTKDTLKKEYTIKAGAVNKTFKQVNATNVKLSGALRSIGAFVPLINYSARQTKKGVTVQIKKGGKRELWPGAFITTMKSGHKGVFSREKPPYKTKKSPKLPWKQFEPKYRLPIHEQFGPRVPGIMGKKQNMNEILEKVDKRMEKKLHHEMDFELSKLK